jgi:hypothetical protein
MEEQIIELYGSIRIKNPKTLQRWIDLGWYAEQVQDGYQFATGCGRFRLGKCECTKCRKPHSDSLSFVLRKNGLI